MEMGCNLKKLGHLFKVLLLSRIVGTELAEFAEE